MNAVSHYLRSEEIGFNSCVIFLDPREKESFSKFPEFLPYTVRFRKPRKTDLGEFQELIFLDDTLQAKFSLASSNSQVLRRIADLNAGKLAEERKWKKIAGRMVMAFLLMVIGHLLIDYLPLPTWQDFTSSLSPFFTERFFLVILTGFLAQLVDGLLSMGYGVTSATCLMSLGLPPVTVSAVIHTSEVFSSGISGYSHYRFGNVNRKLFKLLLIPGVIGAVLGAFALVYLGKHTQGLVLPLIAFYALLLGVRIIFRAFNENARRKKVKRVGWLAGTGGFLDSFGGGGWGPIVTSTLIAKGRSPRYTIGSVSLAEFFITIASALSFFIATGVSHWPIVIGMLVGGMLAAPLAARLTGKLPRRPLMILVGIMVIAWCIRIIIISFN